MFYCWKRTMQKYTDLYSYCSMKALSAWMKVLGGPINITLEQFS